MDDQTIVRVSSECPEMTTSSNIMLCFSISVRLPDSGTSSSSVVPSRRCPPKMLAPSSRYYHLTHGPETQCQRPPELAKQEGIAFRPKGYTLVPPAHAKPSRARWRSQCSSRPCEQSGSGPEEVHSITSSAGEPKSGHQTDKAVVYTTPAFWLRDLRSRALLEETPAQSGSGSESACPIMILVESRYPGTRGNR